ncbi:hypothetical protein IAT38_004768 [Cryptococcus sp. DSM 104549]
MPPGNTQHHITHRMVPLICQALITSPEDETVWLEGLRLLSNPKLRPALPLTSSIWLPLLLKGLEVTKPRTVTAAALRLLVQVAETLEPMKNCLVKPLRALGKEDDVAEMYELLRAVERLDITVFNSDKRVVNRSKSLATLEACNVPEMVVTSRNQVDNALVSLLSDSSVGKDIVIVILDLLAFFHKDKKNFSPAVHHAAKACALSQFQGALNQPLPGVILWYMEQQAETFPTQENVANLVETNIRVGSAGYDAAWSSLLWLENDWKIEPEPMWITQLSHWQQALDAQDKIDDRQKATTYSSFNTRMICYHALGAYQQGYELAQNLFEGLNDHERRNTAHWATAAAWHMGDFETMADYLAFHPKGTSKSLYKAIIDVHNEQYASAFHHINKAQSLSYDELQVQLGVGPQEAIQYKSQPELRGNILNTWKTRFKRSHADANSWLKRLEVWTLACPPTTFQLQSCFLNTAKLCESAGMHQAAQSIITRITPEITPPGCKVEYTKFRFEWKAAFQQQDQRGMESVLQRLYQHTADFLQHIGVNQAELEAAGLGLQPLLNLDKHTYLERQILARRYYRLGEWTAVLQGGDWLQDENSVVLTYTSLASKLDTAWYAAAFSLAERSISLFETNGFLRTDVVAVSSYIVPALRGLFQAARTKESPEFVIKALLRLVTLWFRFGESQAVLVEVENQLNLTEVDPWLSAIPQLIARLGTPHRDLQYTLINLLKNIASHYPHAVIWPLMTATQTRKIEHQEAARVIMNFICTMPDGTRLVEQAELVGKELIRTSISWMEKWRNLVDKCLPRQDLMEITWQNVPLMWQDDLARLQTPETPDEEQFVQQFGEQIIHVNKVLMREADRWAGQYDPHLKLDDQAFIDGFQPGVDVLSSKQLPRKLVIRSYLTDYTFLLKGNEDLRGDERIMQLFNLINTLLNHHSEAFSRNLHLLPYEVVPLSPSAGLVSWVPNTQQLQSMIQANRDKDKHNTLTNKELASLLGYDPKQDTPRIDAPAEMDRYDKLPLSTKVQRLKGALSHSDQSDIKDVLWQRSPSPDIWIKRRTNFARTIGAGSKFAHLASRGGLETPGSRGTFKQASLIVMDVLRDSRSTLLAMLEAFLYDPLLSWTANLSDPSDAAHVSGQEAKNINATNRLATTAVHVGLEPYWIRYRPTTDTVLAQAVKDQGPTHVVPESIGPNHPAIHGDPDVFKRIDNSLVATYMETDSYMAKVSGTGMTNSKALQVLAEIERRLVDKYKSLLKRRQI